VCGRWVRPDHDVDHARHPSARARHRRFQRDRPRACQAVRRERLRPRGQCRGGPFVDNDIADEQEIIDLNITSTVHLAKHVLRDMVVRGEGRVLITSSIASTQPGSFQAVYNASKSFLQSFAEAVRNELKDTGGTVTSLMPGPTETNFFHRADMEDTRVGQANKDDPAQVAEQGFRALMKGEEKVVAASLTTKAMEAASGVLPDKVKAAVHRKMAEPGSGSE
jgi:short-subunit dehydrogenase